MKYMFNLTNPIFFVTCFVLSACFHAQATNLDTPTPVEDKAAQDLEIEVSEQALEIYQELTQALALENITDASKALILDNFSPALVGEWSYFAIDNAVLADSKFIDNPVKIYDLTIANEQRIYNVSFTYFPQVKQIYYTRKEYINSSAENVILALDEAKKDDELMLKFESGATHFFERKNYADYLTVKVSDVSGMISYVNSGIIDIEFVKEETTQESPSQ
jgi:hypothetical protein